MSQLLGSSLSDEGSEDELDEIKRPRHESSRSYSLNRKFDRQRIRRSRYSSRDSNSHSTKESNMEGLICDNGAYTIKINYSFEKSPKIIPNCIMKAKSERKRLFIGSQIDECRDCSGLFYLLPTERGYITKWDVQKPIWDHVFNKNGCPIGHYPLIMTQPLFNFKSIQDCVDEIFFEEYEVNSMLRVHPSDLAFYKYQQEIRSKVPCIIVDSGYSFTHVIPYLEGNKYLNGIKRINVGGKLLTNHLKDIISYRQYHVMEETFVMNQVKEDTCFVSQDFKSDLNIAGLPPAQNDIIKNYVLPDFNLIRRGYIHDLGKKDDVAENFQILRLNNERFTVPEILFHPSDIGIKSVGIAEAIFKSISSCPKYYQKDLAKNIVCIGGSTKFSGFRNRLYNEVRSMIPASWEVKVYQPSDPVAYSWMGGKVLLKDPKLKSRLVTRQQYEELGLSAIQERYNAWVEEEDLHHDSEPKRKPTSISYIEHIKKYDVFGKGNTSEEIGEENSAKGADVENRKCDEEVDVSNKSELEDKNGTASDNLKVVTSTAEKQSDLTKGNHKGMKKNLRNSSGPIIYSVKIVSSTSKMN